MDLVSEERARLDAALGIALLADSVCHPQPSAELGIVTSAPDSKNVPTTMWYSQTLQQEAIATLIQQQQISALHRGGGLPKLRGNVVSAQPGLIPAVVGQHVGDSPPNRCGTPFSRPSGSAENLEVKTEVKSAKRGKSKATKKHHHKLQNGGQQLPNSEGTDPIKKGQLTMQTSKGTIPNAEVHVSALAASQSITPTTVLATMGFPTISQGLSIVSGYAKSGLAEQLYQQGIGLVDQDSSSAKVAKTRQTGSHVQWNTEKRNRQDFVEQPLDLSTECSATLSHTVFSTGLIQSSPSPSTIGIPWPPPGFAPFPVPQGYTVLPSSFLARFGGLPSPVVFPGFPPSMQHGYSTQISTPATDNGQVISSISNSKMTLADKADQGKHGSAQSVSMTVPGDSCVPLAVKLELKQSKESQDSSSPPSCEQVRLPPKKRRRLQEDYGAESPTTEFPETKQKAFSPQSTDPGYGSLGPTSLSPKESSPTSIDAPHLLLVPNQDAGFSSPRTTPGPQWVHIDKVREMITQLQLQMAYKTTPLPTAAASSPQAIKKEGHSEVMANQIPSSNTAKVSAVVKPIKEEMPKSIKVPVQTTDTHQVNNLTDNQEQEKAIYNEDCRKAITPDEDGDLPLHLAIVHQKNEVIYRLIELMKIACASINHTNNLRQSPLHLAVITKNPLVVQLLLAEHADPNLSDRNGNTAVHLAVNYRSRECLYVLLHNSPIKVKMNVKNYEGYTPLHLAVITVQPEMVHKLLEDYPRCESPVLLDLPDGKSGRTALFHAAENNQFGIATALLKKQASVGVSNYAGTTAVQAANGRGYSEMVALLIKYGADVTPKEPLEIKPPMSLPPENELPFYQAKESKEQMRKLPCMRKRQKSENDAEPVEVSSPATGKTKRMDKQKVLELLKSDNGLSKPASLPADIIAPVSTEVSLVVITPPVMTTPLLTTPPVSKSMSTGARANVPPKSLIIPPPTVCFSALSPSISGSRTPGKVPKSPQQLLLEQGVTSPTFVTHPPLTPSAAEQKALLEKISPSMPLRSPQANRGRLSQPTFNNSKSATQIRPLLPNSRQGIDDQIVPNSVPLPGPNSFPTYHRSTSCIALDLSSKGSKPCTATDSEASNTTAPSVEGKSSTEASICSDGEEGELQIDERPNVEQVPVIRLPAGGSPGGSQTSPGRDSEASVEMPLRVNQRTQCQGLEHSSSVELTVSGAEEDVENCSTSDKFRNLSRPGEDDSSTE